MRTLLKTPQQMQKRIDFCRSNFQKIEFFRLQNLPKFTLLKMQKNCIRKIQILQNNAEHARNFENFLNLESINKKINSLHRILNNVRFFLD
jgi:hypothetical protein